MTKLSEEIETKIVVTSIKLDGHSVRVPHGLSELLESTWSSEREEMHYMDDYNREVIKRDGQFVTVLTKKQQKKENLNTNDSR